MGSFAAGGNWEKRGIGFPLSIRWEIALIPRRGRERGERNGGSIDGQGGRDVRYGRGDIFLPELGRECEIKFGWRELCFRGNCFRRERGECVCASRAVSTYGTRDTSAVGMRYILVSA